MDRRRREPLNCVAGLLITLLALTCVGVPAVAAPDSIQGSRMALSQAEMEMLQRQVALDLMAAIDAKDRCDLEAFNRIHDTLLTKLRLAAASITEMARLSQQMSLRLTEIAAELQRLLPPGVGDDILGTASSVALLGAGALPVVGDAISAVQTLADAANDDAAMRESIDIINRLQEQYEQILEVLRNAERWQTLHDEIAEAISRAVTYQGGPCGPDDALPGDAERDAGAEVAKPGLSMTGAGGNPVETTMVRFPPDDDTDASVVAEDEVIDPDSTYIVDAQCHEPQTVAGRDLIRERGVRLRHTSGASGSSRARATPKRSSRLQKRSRRWAWPSIRGPATTSSSASRRAARCSSMIRRTRQPR